jgi:hypothetical protein
MSSKFICGVSSKALGDSSSNLLPLAVDLESRFKYTHSAHAATYLSLRTSINGCKILFGFKLAGLKIHLPIYIIGEENSVSTEVVSTLKDDVKQAAIVLCLFAVGSGLMRWEGKRQEEKLIVNWKRTVLLELRRKHEQTQRLVKVRSEDSQRAMDGKLVVWRAFYGQKSEIVKYLDRLQMAGFQRVYRSFDQAI